MDIDKLSTGEKIAGGLGVLLFIFMFFDWFGVEVSGVGGFSGTVPAPAAAPGTRSTSSRSSSLMTIVARARRSPSSASATPTSSRRSR